MFLEYSDKKKQNKSHLRSFTLSAFTATLAEKSINSPTAYLYYLMKAPSDTKYESSLG